MKIGEYFKSRGLSTKLMAQKLGVTRQALEQYTNGKHKPSYRTVAKIAAAMTEMGAETTIADVYTAIEENTAEAQ